MPESNEKGWLSRAKGFAKNILVGAEEIDSLREDFGYGSYDGMSVSTILSSSKKPLRDRTQIYQKWHFMLGDPIISSAIRLHVTQALGGHETTGDTIFIERRSDIAETDPRAKIVAEIAQDLSPVFNRIAHQVAFNGAGFGDAYGRVYTKEKVGIVDIYTDEMIYPPLVQSYERANRTVGYIVSTGEKFTQKMTVNQIVRMKMPRLLYVPQVRAMEKSVRASLKEDDIDSLPILPALAGGSFLDAAEESFDNLLSALSGLVGQRILSSIDENIISANFAGMTLEQRKEFKSSLVKMLQSSKARIEEAVANNQPATSRFFHVMPTFNDKQLAQISSFSGGGGSGGNFTTEDVIFHAKMLSGALGIDLSMLGFADQLNGGLGEGGFFRVSAQAAERSRLIRTSLTEFFNECIEVHCLARYGWVFEEKDRPYSINYFGSISALESEKAATRERAMNSSAMLVQTMAGIRELGIDEAAVKLIFTKLMDMDGDLAEALAKALTKSTPPAGAMGDMGGGNPDGADELSDEV